LGTPLPPQPLPICLPPGPKEGGHTRFRERGWGNPIQTTGQKLSYSICIVYSLYASYPPKEHHIFITFCWSFMRSEIRIRISHPDPDLYSQTRLIRIESRSEILCFLQTCLSNWRATDNKQLNTKIVLNCNWNNEMLFLFEVFDAQVKVVSLQGTYELFQFKKWVPIRAIQYHCKEGCKQLLTRQWILLKVHKHEII